MAFGCVSLLLYVCQCVFRLKKILADFYDTGNRYYAIKAILYHIFWNPISNNTNMANVDIYTFVIREILEPSISKPVFGKHKICMKTVLIKNLR
jgi:hypothetical protein